MDTFLKPVIAIIPARYGSTRFPGKPLVKIQGKTLIQRTYENAKNCPLLDDMIVATDDQRIFDHVISFGGKVVMTPDNCPTGSDRLAYVLNTDPSLQKAEMIVNIQGDEPCLDPSDISKIISILRDDPTAVMSTAAVRLESEEEAYNPSEVKCILDLHGNALYFSRSFIPGGHSLRFRADVPCYKHIGIYAYRPEFLLQYAKMPMTPLQRAEDLEQLKVLENGYKIKAAVVARASAGVNTPEDIKKVELELCKQSLFSLQGASAPHLAKG
jgi:3-deoxy-manno-octulosonate cytidylyltransferase (CMP-KDO synthetase)